MTATGEAAIVKAGREWEYRVFAKLWIGGLDEEIIFTAGVKEFLS